MECNSIVLAIFEVQYYYSVHLSMAVYRTSINHIDGNSNALSSKNN